MGKLSSNFLLFFILVFLLSACDSEENSQKLQEKIDALEKQVLELQTIINENKLRDINEESDKDFDSSLNNSNIDGHYGPLHQGSWGHRYALYLRTILQRLFFEEEYYWIEGGQVETNPIKSMIGIEKYQNHLRGIKFNLSFSSKIKSMPKDIIEVWLFSLNDNNNRLFILDTNQQWYTYDIYDSNLRAEFRVFRSIMDSYDEWNKESIR